MKKNEIKVGGHYRAKVSGKLVTVRVDVIRPTSSISSGVAYDVTNLSTGRKTTFRSAMKFRTVTVMTKVAPRTVADVNRDQAKEMETAIGPIKEEGEQGSDPTPVGVVISPQTTESPASVLGVSPIVNNLRAVPNGNGEIDTLSLSGSTILTRAGNNSLLSKLSSLRTTTNDAPHLIVEARAGTGKTTTLVEALKVLKGVPTPGFVPSPQQQAVFDAVSLSRGKIRTIAFCAFNKSIADELKERVPAGVEAKTMHGMGFSAVRRSFGDVAVKKDRVKNIVLDLLGIGPRPEQNEDETESAFEERVKSWNDQKSLKVVVIRATEELVGLCKMNLTDLKDDGTNLMDLADRHEVETNGSWGDIASLVPRVLDRCRDVGKDKIIDYNDMIWLPVVLDLPVFRFDLLLVDECQDLNRCQQELAKRAGRRLILCGDPKQAIYGFAGADSESMGRLGRELGATKTGCKILPLTVTRRCGKAIVREANRYVKDFTAHESNGEGSVQTMKYPVQPGAVRGEKILLPDDQTYLLHVRDGDMVICRSNAPLTKQCLKFLKLGKRARIQGRNIGDNLIGLVKKMKAASVPDLVMKLGDWLRRETAKEQAKASPDEGKIDRLSDRYESTMVFTDDAKTVEDVTRKIDSVFINDPTVTTAPILLSSIHRVKGLEAKRVFFLRPAVNPGRVRMPDWQRDEESNLSYVGITRAIEELVFVV